MSQIEIRKGREGAYPDVFTPRARAALDALAPLETDRRSVMESRVHRRAARAAARERIHFLATDSYIPRTRVLVKDARKGAFEGAEIPHPETRCPPEGARLPCRRRGRADDMAGGVDPGREARGPTEGAEVLDPVDLRSSGAEREGGKEEGEAQQVDRGAHSGPSGDVAAAAGVAGVSRASSRPRTSDR